MKKINTAEQAQGAEQHENKTPVLLFSNSLKADLYIRKIQLFEIQIEKFSPIFQSIVTDNLNIPFTKEWLKHIIEGNLKDKINEAFTTFKDSQPAMPHPTIFKEFESLVLIIYRPAILLKSTFDSLFNNSAVRDNPYPNGLGQIEAFPIDENNKLMFTEAWETQVRKQFEQWLITEQDFQRHDALKACVKAQDDLKRLYGDDAPHVWLSLNGKGFVTSEEMTNEQLNYLVKW